MDDKKHTPHPRAFEAVPWETARAHLPDTPDRDKRLHEALLRGEIRSLAQDYATGKIVELTGADWAAWGGEPRAIRYPGRRLPRFVDMRLSIEDVRRAFAAQAKPVGSSLPRRGSSTKESVVARAEAWLKAEYPNGRPSIKTEELLALAKKHIGQISKRSFETAMGHAFRKSPQCEVLRKTK